jgi:predicted phage tail protein
MNFDVGSILASLVIGGIGFVAFMYGKKQHRIPQMAIGVVLMVYPYFIPNAWLMSAIAVVLLGLLYALVRMGM